MKTLLKIAAITHLICTALLALLLPIGGITVLAKLCGAGYGWTGACIPFFIALGVVPFLVISMVFIDMFKGGKK